MTEMRLIRRPKKVSEYTGILKSDDAPRVRKSVVVKVVSSATFLKRRRIRELNLYFHGEKDGIDVDTSA